MTTTTTTRSSEEEEEKEEEEDEEKQRRALVRAAAETRRRREEFATNSQRWAREEKERVARKAKERREENARKTERFLPGRRRRRRSETVWSGRKSAHVDLNVEEEEEEEEEDNNKGEEIEQPLLVLPRHSEPNVLYAKEEGEEGEETETKKTTVSSKSISWWCSFTMPEDTEKEKRVKAIEKLRERRRGMSSSSKAEKKETKKESSFVQKEEEMMEEEDEDEEEEEKPIVSISSPRQNLKSKRFRMKQEVSESKDFAGQEAKLLASIARLDEVVKRNDINSMFAKEIEKREEETKTVTPKQENALKPSAARLNLELGLTNETIQIHDEKFFRELLQISRKCTQKSI